MKACLILAALISVSCVCAPPCLARTSDKIVAAAKNKPTQLSADAEHVLIAEATPLSATEMDNMRGGFVDTSGMIYKFGVKVQTALDGIEVFTRSILVTPTGPNGALQATSSASLLPKNIPSAVNVNMVGNGNGVIVTTPGNTDSTTALNQTASGAPASIIFNNANNRSITQTVDVTLTLQNMSAFINNVHSASQGSALAQHSALKAMGF